MEKCIGLKIVLMQDIDARNVKGKINQIRKKSSSDVCTWKVSFLKTSFNTCRLLKMTIQINSVPILYHLDSGSEVNVINEHLITLENQI